MPTLGRDVPTHFLAGEIEEHRFFQDGGWRSVGEFVDAWPEPKMLNPEIAEAVRRRLAGFYDLEP